MGLTQSLFAVRQYVWTSLPNTSCYGRGVSHNYRSARGLREAQWRNLQPMARCIRRNEGSCSWNIRHGRRRITVSPPFVGVEEFAHILFASRSSLSSLTMFWKNEGTELPSSLDNVKDTPEYDRWVEVLVLIEIATNSSNYPKCTHRYTNAIP